MEQEQERRAFLRAQYLAAFGTWAAQVHDSQQVKGTIESAEDMNAALKAYREARNRFVENLTGEQALASAACLN